MANFTDNANYNGLYANSVGQGINLKSSLEDFLKEEYTEGLRNEFAVMPALINSLQKDTISGKKKYKSFALGITDNIRGVGNVRTDLYQIGTTDFIKAGDHVDAEFDTTKLIGVFSITDETLMKGQGDGSLFDVLADTLNRMQMGLEHTMNRYTYGSRNGKIGVVSTATADFTDAANANPGKMTGNTRITENIVVIECSNSLSLLPGMGIMLAVPTLSNTSGTGTGMTGEKVFASTLKYRQGRIWQKDDSTTFDEEKLIVVLDPVKDGDATVQNITACNNGLEGLEAVDSTSITKRYIGVYSRQLVSGEAAPEYTGLEDIVVTQNNTIFGVNRNVYRSLNCLKKNLYNSTSGKNGLLTESVLRDMADKVSLVTPEGAGINLVCAKHGIISTIEKQMYQYKQYSLDTSGNGFQLGRPNIKFDNFELKKDKYARDNNVYLLDTKKIGELIRKDFGWITSGRETILERRDGSEIYEAIMTKYADMYIDAWKAHAVFTNAAESYV